MWHYDDYYHRNNHHHHNFSDMTLWGDCYILKIEACLIWACSSEKSNQKQRLSMMITFWEMFFQEEKSVYSVPTDYWKKYMLVSLNKHFSKEKMLVPEVWYECHRFLTGNCVDTKPSPCCQPCSTTMQPFDVFFSKIWAHQPLQYNDWHLHVFWTMYWEIISAYLCISLCTH